MAREVFATDWIKLEVIGDDDLLQPDVFGLVEAAGILVARGLQGLSLYDRGLLVAEKLVGAGCEVLMPWGAPIGSGRGLNNVFGLQALRKHFPSLPLIVDAGIGTPAHAAAAMELGYDAVLLNTAVAKAGDPVMMARLCPCRRGRPAWLLCRSIPPRDMAEPSTPQIGRAFSDLSKRA